MPTATLDEPRVIETAAKLPSRILIVDDEQAMRFFLSEAMTKLGYEVVAAEDSETALDLAAQEELDLAILDIRLPGLSGIEAISKMRQINPNIVPIVMTAYGSRQLALEAIKAGAYDLFTKPFKIDELNVVIQRALEKRRLQNNVCSSPMLFL